MKKVLCVVLSLILAISLVGCGKPKHMSDEVYNGGKQAVDIIDAYLDHKTDGKETSQKLENIGKSIKDVEKQDMERVRANPKNIDEEFYTSYLASSISTAAMYAKSNNTTEVLKKRNELAKKINMGERK